MIRFLKMFFINSWKRKTLSIFLAAIIWFVVDESLMTTKTFSNVNVRVVNIPSDRTIENIQSNGLIDKKTSFSLVGNKEILDHIQPSDLEVIIDATNKPEEWAVSITKKNVVSLNPDIELSNHISKVIHYGLLVQMPKLITEKLKIIVSTPTGEPPRGYQFLEAWPYRLELPITGPEEVIKRLCRKEMKLSFDLSWVQKKQLDALIKNPDSDECTVVHYYVPESWKYIKIPQLSDTPIAINDPSAKHIRIDFIRSDLHRIDFPIPIQFFYTPSKIGEANPNTTRIISSKPLLEKEGIYIIDTPLCAKGADNVFFKLIQNHLLVEVVVDPSNRDLKRNLHWSVQVVDAQSLEEEYVRELSGDKDQDDAIFVEHAKLEEYLRNRFRSYMSRLDLYHPDGNPLKLSFYFSDNNIVCGDNVFLPSVQELPTDNALL
jgi:hypothetical protein